MRVHPPGLAPRSSARPCAGGCEVGGAEELLQLELGARDLSLRLREPHPAARPVAEGAGDAVDADEHRVAGDADGDHLRHAGPADTHALLGERRLQLAAQRVRPEREVDRSARPHLQRRRWRQRHRQLVEHRQDRVDRLLNILPGGDVDTPDLAEEMSHERVSLLRYCLRGIGDGKSLRRDREEVLAQKLEPGVRQRRRQHLAGGLAPLRRGGGNNPVRHRHSRQIRACGTGKWRS